jgi:hypothetical protein
MRAFSQAQKESFEVRAFAYLRQWHATDLKPLDDAALNAFIRRGIIKARGYGITREIDVLRFLEIMVTLGPDFDTSPQLGWTKECLLQPLHAEERLDLICQRYYFEGGNRR